jgi:hypothetical protein
MLNENRSDDRNRQNNTGGMILGTLAVLAVLAALFMWAPWNEPKTADNSAGTTVGLSTTRPATAPASPATTTR